MDAENMDRQARVVTALRRGLDELEGNLGAADFDQRAVAIGKGLLDGAKAMMPAAEVALDLRPVGEVGPEWLSERLPSRPALLTLKGKPWLIQGKVGLLVAPGGTGKTWALLQLAVAVATGGKLFDTFDATKGRVLLALGEEDAEEVRRRLYDVVHLLRLTEYERAELMRNLTILGLAGQDVALLGRGANGEPIPSKWFGTVRNTLEAAGPWRCVLLDPWSRWGGPDVETDNHAATRGVELLEELTKAAGGATVLVAHHTRKKGQGETTSGADADSSRGASALVDGARWVANLERHKSAPGLLSLKVSKHNHTADSEAVWLVRTTDGPLRRANADEVDEAKNGGKREPSDPAVLAATEKMLKDEFAERAENKAKAAEKEAEDAERKARDLDLAARGKEASATPKTAEAAKIAREKADYARADAQKARAEATRLRVEATRLRSEAGGKPAGNATADRADAVRKLLEEEGKP